MILEYTCICSIFKSLQLFCDTHIDSPLRIILYFNLYTHVRKSLCSFSLFYQHYSYFDNDIKTLMFDCTRRLYYQLKTMIGITIRAKNS